MTKSLGLRLSALITGIFLLVAAGCGSAGNNKITASGTIESTEVNVNAETGGKITDILVVEGARVKKGDLLARIDSTVQALQVQQAEAALRAAQEKSKETKGGSREQLIAQAQAGVKQMSSLAAGASQTVKNAKDNLDRTNALYKEGATTSQQVADAQTRYETAKAQYDAYMAQKKSAQEQVDLLKSGATQETINIADAGTAQAQANLAIAKAMLERTAVYAPVNGIVKEVTFNKGEYVSPGSDIVAIIDDKDSWINVYISEKELPKLKLNQQADIFTDAFPDKPFAGKISFISNEAEFTPKNLQTKEERVNMVFAVKIKIFDKDGLVKPGLPADVTIRTQ